MKTSAPPFLWRSFSCAATVVLIAVLTACTATGGGQLPPSAGFNGPASFGVNFSCEDKGGVNPPTGQLRTQLSYTEHGTYLPLGSPFTIHGIVDMIDPILESALCIGQNPSRRKRADLPGPLPADDVRSGGLGSVPEAGDVDHAVVPLRGHRAGQRPEPNLVDGRLLLDQAVERDRSRG